MAATNAKIIWTPHQENILLTEWSRNTTVRKIAAILGMASATVCAKRRELGLPDREDVRSSATRRDIVRVLRGAEPMSRAKIAEKIGRDGMTVARYLTRMRNTREVHIVEWEVCRGGLIPIYQYGPGEDAPKLSPEKIREQMRKRMQHARMAQIRAKEESDRLAVEDRLAYMTKLAKQTARRGAAGAFDLMVHQIKGEGYASK